MNVVVTKGMLVAGPKCRPQICKQLLLLPENARKPPSGTIHVW